MPDRRGCKASLEDLLPNDRLPWAREIWADRNEVAKLSAGQWMLREAARALGFPEEEVNEVMRKSRWASRLT